MSTILKQRRGGDDKDWCHDGIEDGQLLTKRSLGESNGKSKRHAWRRVSIRNKCTILAGFLCFFLIGQRLLYPTPRLPVLNVDIEVPDADEWPLIHIVQSRFMQEQGPLETLGMARLKLFESFCLPSMVQQTSQNFFWIIKTDPQFTTTAAFGRLVELVEPYDNIYLVASNTNYVFGNAGLEGSWRDGKEALDLLQSKIYSGNMTKLKAAMALRQVRPILETRLDADDGLHTKFIEYIQTEALFRLRPNDDMDDSSVPNWLYWCSRRHIEWHSSTDGSLSKEQETNAGSPEFGYMNMVQHDKICVTPGVTIGYNTMDDDNIVDVPLYGHDVLYKRVFNSSSCYSSGDGDDNDSDEDGTASPRGPCLELIEDFLFMAIRSRTWTSTGMDKVDLPSVDVLVQDEDFTEKLWRVSEYAFGVTKTSVMKTQDFLVSNKRAIAAENLLGQCTTGHSCKGSAKEKLRKIVNSKPKALQRGYTTY